MTKAKARVKIKWLNQFKRWLRRNGDGDSYLFQKTVLKIKQIRAQKSGRPIICAVQRGGVR